VPLARPATARICGPDPAIARIAHAEGFALRADKTRIMPRGTRQHLAGLVVNERLGVPRDALERLEATLINCVRRGPSSENRLGHDDFRAHVAGRLAWVNQVEPRRGAKLHALFEAITW
jgi:RNA-directed DNA polymerase